MVKPRRSKPSSRRPTVDSAARLVTTLAGLVVAVAGAASVLRGPQAMFGWLLISSALLFLVAVWQWRKTLNAVSKARACLRHRVVHRMALVLGLIAVGVVAWLLTHPSLPRTVVLVADFADRPFDDKYRTTDIIVNSLHSAFAQYRDTDVVLLGHGISERDGSAVARAEGRRRKAAIVIWGSCAATQSAALVTVHVEILVPLVYDPKLKTAQTGQPRRVPVSELETYTLQLDLAKEMAYFTLFAAGALRSACGDTVGAIRRYSDAIDQAAPGTDVSAAYLLRGHCHLLNGQPERAIPDFDQALRLDPRNADAYQLRGSSYFVNGSPRRAIEDLSKAIQLNPQYARAYYNRGMAYKDDAQPDRAIPDLSKAIQLGLGDAEAYRVRGMAYMQIGDLHRAMQDCDQAIMLDPRLCRAYCSRSRVQMEVGHPELAIVDCNDAIGVDPGYAEAYFYRGLAYFLQHESRGAISDFTAAIRLDPQLANAYMNRAIAYREEGDMEKAYADYDKAAMLRDDEAMSQRKGNMDVKIRHEYGWGSWPW